MTLALIAEENADVITTRDTWGEMADLLRRHYKADRSLEGLVVREYRDGRPYERPIPAWWVASWGIDP